MISNVSDLSDEKDESFLDVVQLVERGQVSRIWLSRRILPAAEIVGCGCAAGHRRLGGAGQIFELTNLMKAVEQVKAVKLGG